MAVSVAFVLGGTGGARAESSTGLVSPCQHQSNNRTLDWIGEGISELINQRLQPEPGVYVFPRDERITMYDRVGIPETASLSRATALKLAWDAGADYMITGVFS